MIGGPAVEAAAVAVLLGAWPFPWPYTATPAEWQWLVSAAMERAMVLRSEELKTLVEAVGAHVGNRVGEVMVRALGAR